MEKEYMTFQSLISPDEKLNELGRNGWELITSSTIAAIAYRIGDELPGGFPASMINASGYSYLREYVLMRNIKSK